MTHLITEDTSFCLNAWPAGTDMYLNANKLLHKTGVM